MGVVFVVFQSSQDYGGLAYTTTSEPEFHMNEILHLARGLTP